MPARLAALLAPPALLLATAVPAGAETILDRCTAETCKARLTPDQLLGEVQQLIAAKRYDDAKPLLAALSAVPTLRFETRFLTGYVAEQTGDYGRAEAMFRAILVEDPTQTRVRLELGRTLLAMGKAQSADHQLRLAAEADDLPPEIARTIRSVRNIIRSKRAWSVNVDFGIAPDSNINNATAADSISFLYGNQPIQLSLDKASKARSGTGITGSVDAGLRLPIAKDALLLIDVDGFGTNYAGSAYDDISLEAATGPEFKLSEKVSVRAEALVAQRDFGGRVASRQVGIKGGGEIELDKAQRVGLQIDVRHTDAKFNRGYSGWQMGAYATYERVIARSLIASGSVFVRRDDLKAMSASSVEVGGIVGIGGELPKGFNFGLSVGGSRAVYESGFPFSADPRKDWRYNARLTLGNRAIRVWGFSPAVSLSYGRNDSSITFYQTERTRLRFTLARYF
jgi:tetratricopeptide (TPR) repeat protein